MGKSRETDPDKAKGPKPKSKAATPEAKAEIKTKPSPNIKTKYGTVNRKVLERLQNNFDTMQILYAIDAIDQIRYRICEPDQIRDQLLNLHGMAHCLINGDHSATVRGNPGEIWELADELESEISEFASSLRGVADMLDKLVMLVPDDDWDEDDQDD
ncbi:MAG: Tn3 family transposase post-transcriptional regulator TnpC [Acidobacteriota bacterium]